MHPPLYFTLLHTISSFFPDTFSKWFGYVINIAAMAVGQVFLYKLGKTASKSKVFGLLLCVMWGFSCGFINLNVFVRMYSLVTMFGILYLYYHCRLYYGEGTVKSNLIKIGIFAFLGALTHHYFLVAAFGIAACYCFYYLFKKQFKMMFAYALQCWALSDFLLRFSPQRYITSSLWRIQRADLLQKCPLSTASEAALLSYSMP